MILFVNSDIYVEQWAFHPVTKVTREQNASLGDSSNGLSLAIFSECWASTNRRLLVSVGMCHLYIARGTLILRDMPSYIVGFHASQIKFVFSSQGESG
jgi:hypothetical protein